MNKIIAFLFIFIVGMHSNKLLAAVYQEDNANGTVVYSDIPLNSDAKQIDIPKGNKITSPTSPTNTIDTNNTTLAKTVKIPYSTFIITSPADQDTIQNQITIPVTIEIKPDLQPGDKIQLIVDGKPSGDALPSIHLQLFQIDRGTHQLSAVIIDNNQQVIKKSNNVTIYNHRASVNSIKANKANFGGLQ